MESRETPAATSFVECECGHMSDVHVQDGRILPESLRALDDEGWEFEGIHWVCPTCTPWDEQ
jgi:hypothetical protein